MRYAGETIDGKGRGKRIGFPTLNFKIPKEFPYEYGIYAGFVHAGGKPHQAVFHYGPIPTFHEETPSLEAFIINGVHIEKSSALSFELVKKLREIKMFDEVDELVTQIRNDISNTKKVLD